MNKVNCFVGILLALVFCSSCSAKSPEITGNPDPPNITSEERSLHQILRIDEDTSYAEQFAMDVVEAEEKRYWDVLKEME